MKESRLEILFYLCAKGVSKISTVAELLVKIGADSSGLRKEIQASQRQLKRAFGPESLELSQGVAGMLAGLATALGLAGAASVKMAADFNANKTAFTQLLGDASKAEAMLNDLAKFAADTPFELPGVINASKKLLAFQFAAEDIIPIMAAVGDAVSLMGGGQEAIDGIVRALGQIQAKGKLSAEKMNQLTERGINGWKYIAEEMGLTTAEVMKLSEDGAIDATTAINAVVMGMQKDFKGGMAAMSKEIPGLLSTIKDNAGAVMRQIGDQITTALDLKAVLQKVADQLSTFASAVQSAGIKNAILGLVPPEAVAAVFALGGAFVTIAIPALLTFAGAMWLAIAPMAPYIALGAAIGVLAYELWKNWEPLSGLFSGLWEGILANTSIMWNNMKRVFYSGVQNVLETIQPLANLIGGDLQLAVGGYLDSLPAKMASAAEEVAKGNEALAGSINKIKEAKSGLNVGLKGVNISGLLPSDSGPVNTQFTGLHNTSNSGLADGKAAKEAAKEWEKLDAKAKQVSEAIEREWVQTTHTQLEQLDVWKNEQLASLEETKAANENYERDKLRVAATYSVRRIKIIQDEQRQTNSIWDKAADLARNIQQKIGGIGLKGVDKQKFDIESDAKNQITSVQRGYRDLAEEYDRSTDVQKEQFRLAWEANGLQFEITASGMVNFSRQIATEQVAIEQEKNQKIQDLHYNRVKFQEQLDDAQQNGEIQRFSELLQSKQAFEAQDLSGRQEMITAYYNVWKETHRSAMSYMAEAMGSFQGGMESIFKDMGQGIKTAGDLWRSFGSMVMGILNNIIAKKLAAQITESIFGGILGIGGWTSASAGSSGTTAGSLPARAYGGPVMSGSAYLVGEKGPEIFIPSSAGYIMSNRDSLSSGSRISGASAAGTAPEIEVNIHNYSSSEVKVDNPIYDPATRKYILSVMVDGLNNDSAVRRATKGAAR